MRFASSLPLAVLLVVAACTGDSVIAVGGPADGPDASPGADGGTTPVTPNDAGDGDGGPKVPPALGDFTSVTRLPTGENVVGDDRWPVARTPDGGYVLATRYTGTITIGATMLTAAGDVDAALVKLDAAGQVTWAKSVGGTLLDVVNSVAADDAGNIYVAGNSRSATVGFAGGNELTNPAGAGSVCGFLARFDADGVSMWSRSFHTTTGTTPSGYVSNVYVAAKGSRLAVAGTFGTNALRLRYTGPAGSPLDAVPSVGGNGSVFAMSVNVANGFTEWATVLDSTGPSGSEASLENANAVALAPDNHVVVGGFFSGEQLTSTGSDNLGERKGNARNAFAAKLDVTSGGVLWARTFGAPGGTERRTTTTAVTVDARGTVYAAGNFEGAVDFGAGARTANGAMPDVFVVALDGGGGATLLDKTFGTDARDGLFGLAVDPWGSMILSVENETATADANVDGIPLPKMVGMSGIKLDAAGTAKWVKSISRTKAGGIAVAPSGAIAFVGVANAGGVDYGQGEVTPADFETFFLLRTP